MKVLRVIASMDPSSGGPCQGIRNSIPELEKLGQHHEVVCLDNPKADYLKDDPFLIYALGNGKGPWNYNATLYSWLMENLQRFDVVIVHGLWSYHSYAVKKAVLNAKRRKNKPVPGFFVMPHGMLDPYFQKAKSRRLKAIRNWFFWKLIEREVVNRADGLLFTCEAEKILAREPFRPYLPQKELNVGYGIKDPPEFNSGMREAFLKKCPGLNNRPYLLFLSRIHEKKGVEMLIEAYIELLKEGIKVKAPFSTGSDPKWKEKWPVLIIAGPGMDTVFGETLKLLAMEANRKAPIILFPGMLTGDAKWGAFYGCEAFVLPSHQENFGIAVVEALACSKPVLISDQVNIWKEIQAGGGGLVAKDNLGGTKNLLSSWAALSEEEQKSMGLKAKETFKVFFNIHTHAVKLLKAIS